MAAAKPSWHAVYPSSGYRELSIAPEASSASHSAWQCGQSCSNSKLEHSYHLHTHDAGVDRSVRVLFGGAKSSSTAQSHQRGEESGEGKHLNHLDCLLRRMERDATATDQHKRSCESSINTPYSHEVPDYPRLHLPIAVRTGAVMSVLGFPWHTWKRRSVSLVLMLP